MVSSVHSFFFISHCSGSRSGAIHSHDVRVADHHVATLVHHTQEICGLKWSSDGRFLASGANDNVVNVWDSSLGMDVVPLHTFTEHLAAVKVIFFLFVFTEYFFMFLC